MIYLDEVQDRELVRAALLHYACLCRGSEVAAILSDDLDGEVLWRDRRFRADALRALIQPEPVNPLYVDLPDDAPVPVDDGPDEDLICVAERSYENWLERT